jgi:hypothetical protein
MRYQDFVTCIRPWPATLLASTYIMIYRPTRTAAPIACLSNTSQMHYLMYGKLGGRLMVVSAPLIHIVLYVCLPIYLPTYLSTSLATLGFTIKDLRFVVALCWATLQRHLDKFEYPSSPLPTIIHYQWGSTTPQWPAVMFMSSEA